MGISGVFCELKILKFRSQTSTKGGVVRGVFVRGAAKVGKNEHHAEAKNIANEAKSLKIAPPN